MVVVGALALASLGLALLNGTGFQLPRGGSVLGFYSPVTRAWEFAAGSLIALVPGGDRARGPRSSLFLGVSGVALLVVSLFAIDGDRPFPGAVTLLPVAAAVLLVVAGSRTEGATARLLGARPLVLIGDRSYAIYLWHWPFAVLAARVWPQHPRAVPAAVLLSLVPAALSYRYVELPLRATRGAGRALGPAFVLRVLLPPIVLAAGLWVSAEHYWAPRYEEGRIAAAYPGEVGQRAFHAHLRDTARPCTPEAIRAAALDFEGMPRCHQSRSDALVTVAPVGDSHSEHLFPGFAAALTDENVVHYTVDALPLRGDPPVDRILDHVERSPSIHTVIVSAHWLGRGGVPVEGLASTLRPLVAAGKRVYVTDDVPSFPFDAFSCAYGIGPLVRWPRCTVVPERAVEQYRDLGAPLARVVRAVPGVRLLETYALVCDRANCSMVDDGVLIYRDDTHLNVDGSVRLVAELIASHPELARPATAD